MSSKGVAHFWDGVSEFVGLDQFERDYFLYTQLMRLRMFRQFKLWKAFRVRRREGGGRVGRRAEAMHSLGGGGV